VIRLGVAVPGPVGRGARPVFLGDNRGWGQVRRDQELERATGLPTLLDNDANLAALGEARCGAGRGVRNLVYVTVSTGVGSGVISNGAILDGEYGLAGEVGHTVIWPGGRACGCGNRGCLEAYASGTAIAD